jgi:diguanylate cyclase (GGDEF)-like protein
MDRAKPLSQDGLTPRNVDHAAASKDIPAADDAALYRRPDFLFGIVLFAVAVAALVVASPGHALHGIGEWTRAAFFLAFSLFTISIGYPHPTFGHVSFDRVAQVSSVLVLGTVEAAWIACLTSLLYPLHRLRHGVPRGQVIDASLTNAGLMTLAVLGAGLLYERFGGQVPLTSLGLVDFGLTLLLILVMQVVNELFMVVIYFFRSKRPGEVVSLFETATELVSGLIAVLVAIVYTRMETSVFVLLLAVLAAGMVGLKQFADMRRHLEQLVAARTEALREKSAELEELAIRDVLTGLRNRRAAEDFLQSAIDEARRYGRELSVALADIDHFKQINDGYSHAVGDAVLQQVGRIFDDRVRSTDLIARYGGEEFLFCFTGTGEDLAGQVCDDLRRAVEAFDWSTVSPGLAVTVSMGVKGLVPGSRPDDLVAAADARLYRAKHMGRNVVVAEGTVTRPSL